MLKRFLNPKRIIVEKEKKSTFLKILKLTLSLWLVFLLILQIVAGVLFLPPIEEAEAANWYNSNWGYRREITIDTGSSATPAYYQVLVTLTTATMGNPYTNVKTDGSDIFFTNANGTTPIDYWIESWDNTGDSKIWVEVPDAIAATSSKTIYMYHGNPDASSASDGTNTFEFFDDFPGSSIDTSKWQGDTDKASVSNSILTYDGGADYTWFTIDGVEEGSLKTFSAPIITEFYAKMHTTTGSGRDARQGFRRSLDTRYAFVFRNGDMTIIGMLQE